MKKNLTTFLFALVAMMIPIGAWAQDAVITGVTITVDGIDFGVGDTAVVTPNTTSLIYTVYGENFANLTNENFIACSQSFGSHLADDWIIDTEKNTATFDYSNLLAFFEINITPYEVKYSNDNMKTWSQSGVYLMYSEQNDEDTSLDQLIHDNQANSHKILRDGQVIILRDGKAYNLMGVAL